MFRNLPHQDWQQLLLEARAGSHQAMGVLLDAYRGYLQVAADHRLHGKLQAKQGASDLVQETYFEAVRGFARFQGQQPDELRNWLRNILDCRLIDFIRRHRTDKRQIDREIALGTDSQPSEGPELVARDITPRTYAVTQEDMVRVWRAMSALPERDAQVLRLRDLESLSFPEIGHQLEMTADAARKTWVRALRRLRLQLAEQ